jgi:hypothetical protein
VTLRRLAPFGALCIIELLARWHRLDARAELEHLF